MRLAVVVVVFLLLWNGGAQTGFLGRRFVPQRYWLANLGAALTCAGMALAIWARYHIGKYWSRTVALKVDHELIRTGPYARIRHPIYTGIIFAIAGTAIAVGTYGALLAFVLFVTDITWKSRREEALLAREFGPAFDEHRRRTGFYFPRFS